MYFDTTLVADTAGGYTYVNVKQRYDAFAAAMTAQGNWTLVDTVDSVSAPTTIRRYVWCCNAPGNGLAAPFYLIFETNFVTATGVWASTSTPGALFVSMCEVYDSGTKVASKFVAQQNSTNVTVASDLTHPATWTLTTYTRPTAPNLPLYSSPNVGSNITSEKHLIVCTASTIASFCGVAGTTACTEFYAGVFDSVMNGTDDPMPIFLGCANGVTNAAGASSFFQNGGTTRHPKLTPGALNGVFGHAFGPVHVTNNNTTTMGAGAYNIAASVPQGGALGDPANLAWPLYLGGPQVSRVCISSSGATYNGSTRGGLRGFLRHVLSAAAPAHSLGDVFKADGRNHVGPGRVTATAIGCPFLDTAA